MSKFEFRRVRSAGSSNGTGLKPCDFPDAHAYADAVLALSSKGDRWRERGFIAIEEPSLAEMIRHRARVLYREVMGTVVQHREGEI